ncbi:MAG: hypothetical protein IJJ38_04180 [Lachnospiraceae bacterium]|nr:hypothetical protein [Lachnospiraceae bacterium]
MDSKTYLFQPEKKILKQGFFMTDEGGNIVCEAKMLKQPLIGAMQFEFVNRLTGKTEPHSVSKTVTTETSTNGFTDLFSTKSRFKLDGKNIWDYLHEAGIRIESHLLKGKLGMSYDVTLKGRPLATVASTTPKGKGMITSPFVYDVTAAEEDLDLAFLVTFAIARTDQTFYN